MVTKDLAISPRFTTCKFISRCKFSTCTTHVNKWLNFIFSLLTLTHVLTLSASDDTIQYNTNSGFHKNRTHDFRPVNFTSLPTRLEDKNCTRPLWRRVLSRITTLHFGQELRTRRSELICMYGHTYSDCMDQPGKVPNPARGQLNREMNISLSRPVPSLLGYAITYQWRSLPKVRRHSASLVSFKVVPNGCCLGRSSWTNYYATLIYGR